MIWSAFSTVTSLISFVIGLRWGVVGVAAAFGISDLLLRMPALWWWVTRAGPIKMIDLYLSAAPFAAGGAVAFVALTALQRAPFHSDLFQLAASAIVAYATSWSMVALFRRGRAAMADSIRLIRTELPRLLLRRGRPKPEAA
jgi:PST family polysaccharide transporter